MSFAYAFNTFTFNIIVNKYDPVGLPWWNHFLNCLGLIFVCFFFLLCFLPREVPLAFVVKLIL